MHEAQPAQDRAQNFFGLVAIALQAGIGDRDRRYRAADFQILRPAEKIVSFAHQTHGPGRHGADRIDKTFSKNFHPHRLITAQSDELYLFRIDSFGVQDRFGGELIRATDALGADAFAA